MVRKWTFHWVQISHGLSWPKWIRETATRFELNSRMREAVNLKNDDDCCVVVVGDDDDDSDYDYEGDATWNSRKFSSELILLVVAATLNFDCCEARVRNIRSAD